MPTLLCTPFLFVLKICDTEKSTKNAGDYLKQVKASRPLVDGPRVTSDGRADRCAVFGKILVTPARSSSVFAAFV